MAHSRQAGPVPPAPPRSCSAGFARFPRFSMSTAECPTLSRGLPVSRRLPAPSCLLCTAPPVLAARTGLLLPLPHPLVVPDSGWRLASRVGTCTGHTQRSRAGPRDMEPAVASNLGSWADLEHRERLLGGFPLAIICLLWCKALGGPT